MPGLTFIEYPPDVHTAVRKAGQEIKENFNDKVDEFLQEVREAALNRSYFLESIGLADYEAQEKIEWELGRRLNSNYITAPGQFNDLSYINPDLDSIDEYLSVYRYNSDLETLEDIDMKFNTLRRTPATSVTLTNEEVEVFNKYVQFNK